LTLGDYSHHEQDCRNYKAWVGCITEDVCHKWWQVLLYSLCDHIVHLIFTTVERRGSCIAQDNYDSTQKILNFNILQNIQQITHIYVYLITVYNLLAK